MASLSSSVRAFIAQRAQNRCEYCCTAQKISGAQMHIEHIQPQSKGGVHTPDNLCYACAWCNSYKGTQTHAVDPETGERVRLFHPRKDIWRVQFSWSRSGLSIYGLTATGRATVAALQMNNEYILPARKYWVSAGWHPPDE